MTAISGHQFPMPLAGAGECYAPSCPPKSRAPEASEPKAIDTLNSLDKVSATLESTLSGLRRALGAFFDVGRLLEGVSNASAVGVHAAAKQRAGIEIRTQEGDVVRIKYSNRLEVNAAAAQASDANGNFSVSEASVAQRERLRVSVQGNLNAEELNAIDAVLKKVEALAQEFFSGDAESAFAQAAAFEFDSAQLADVAVRLSQRKHVSAVAVTHSAPVAVALPAVAAAKEAEPAPVTVESASGAAAAMQSAKEAAPIPESASASIPSVDALQPQAPAVVVPAVEPQQSDVAATLIRFVAKLTTNFRANETDMHLGLTFRAKLDLLLANIQAKQLEGASDAAVNKLNDVAARAGASA